MQSHTTSHTTFWAPSGLFRSHHTLQTLITTMLLITIHIIRYRKIRTEITDLYEIPHLMQSHQFYTHTHTHTNVCTHTCVYTHTHKKYIHTCVHVYIYIYTHNIYTHTIYTHTCIHTPTHTAVDIFHLALQLLQLHQLLRFPTLPYSLYDSFYIFLYTEHSCVK